MANITQLQTNIFSSKRKALISGRYLTIISTKIIV